MSAPTSVRRAPTQERSRRTVRQILDATEQLVAEGGIDAATTRAIAERAGVAVPSLYRFFADRDDILDALLAQLVADLDEHARRAEAEWRPGDIEGLIRLELDLHAAYFESHPSLSALWFGGRASAAVVDAVRRRNHALALRVRDLLASHDLIDQDSPVQRFDLLTELGDRILEVACRNPEKLDRDVLALGLVALTAFVEHGVSH